MNDDRLDLPPPPSRVPHPERVDPRLARAGPARERPFRLTGRRAAAMGTERRGVTAVQADGLLLTGPIRLGPRSGPPAAAANALVGPGVLRRELVVAGATLTETAVVAPGLPGLVVQWRISGSGPWHGRLDVELPPAPGGTSRRAARDGTLRVAGPAGDPSGCVLHLDPASAWAAGSGAGGARADAVLEPGAPLTLLVAAVDASGRPPSLTALADVDAHLRRADHDVAHAPGLRAHTGVSGIDDGLAWAHVLLRGVAGRAGPVPAPRPTSSPPGADVLLEPAAALAWMVAGALALGETDAARTLLDDLGEHPLDAWALAEWVAWTGDGGALLDARRRVEAALEAARPAGLLPLLAGRVADAAEAAGDRTWAAALRAGTPGGRTVAAAGPAGAAPPARAPDDRAAPAAGGPVEPDETRAAPAGGLRLPSLARAPGSVAAAALGGAPGGPLAVSGVPDDPADPAVALLARALYAADEPEEAFALLRPALAAPVTEGPPVDPTAPALVACAFTAGLLGARPDAAFGRLALAPALPASWTRFAVEGLGVGDALLDLDYERDGRSHRWRFRPTAGAVPLMLVLEPVLPLAAVDAVRVDGRTADVAASRRGRRMAVRLQLALDAERSVTVEGPEPDAP